MIFIQLTGLSGAGKTTLATNVKAMLEKLQYQAAVIDGDVYRKTLCQDLGFSRADRMENIRRLGKVSILKARNEVITMMAAINPYQSVREELKTQYDFVYTVWIDCDLATLIQRDTKGLYRRALLPKEHPDKLGNLTGIDDPYEIPLNPDLIIATDKTAVEEASQLLLDFILTKMQAAKASFTPRSLSLNPEISNSPGD